MTERQQQLAEAIRAGMRAERTLSWPATDEREALAIAAAYLQQELRRLAAESERVLAVVAALNATQQEAHDE